jgi:hypothetical protein
MLVNAGSYYFACNISTGFHFQRLDHGSNKLTRDDAVMVSGEALFQGWVVIPNGAIGKRRYSTGGCHTAIFTFSPSNILLILSILSSAFYFLSTIFS